jgi:hypothetical protein
MDVRKVGVGAVLLFAVMLVPAGQTSMLGAQEEGVEGEEPGHENALALFLGGVTHLNSADPNETGFGIGLEYARTVTNRFKVGLIAEYATSVSERDLIAALPLFLHLTEEFILVAAPGVEYASELEGSTEGGESEFLMRFGAAYEMEFDRWIVAPQVNADVVSGDWTFIYGIALGIAF